MTNPNLGRKVNNKFKVPVRQWRKWNNHARRVFNDIYHALRPTMQWVVSHPKMLPLPFEQWKTLRWNCAWLAADAANKNGGATEALRIRNVKR